MLEVATKLSSAFQLLQEGCLEAAEQAARAALDALDKTLDIEDESVAPALVSNAMFCLG